MDLIVCVFDNRESKVVDAIEVIGIQKESFDVPPDYNLESLRFSWSNASKNWLSLLI